MKIINYCHRNVYNTLSLYLILFYSVFLYKFLIAFKLLNGSVYIRRLCYFLLFTFFIHYLILIYSFNNLLISFISSLFFYTLLIFLKLIFRGLF